MNPPNTTLTPDQLEERAAIAFLEQFVADRTAGLPRSLSDYVARGVRFEARIAFEWLLATGQLPTPASAVPPQPAGADRIGPYRLQAELGRGGQGVVYLAEDTRLGRRVALKVLARDVASLAGPALLRLQREADAIARLEHPGIATVYEAGHDETRAWIAMRYVAGPSVQQAIARRITSGLGPPQQRADVLTAVRLVERAARALDTAHRAGILHRDVKPANLLLAAPDEPVLVDFGLAADADGRTPTITMPGAVFGTLCYLAPERLAGATADARADVHALGAVLYELLTLQRPYAAATTASELQAIAESPVPDVRARNKAVPGDLAVVVAVALAKSPADRYQTAAAFADDLAHVLAMEPITARPPGPFVRLQRWAQRNPGLATSLLLLVLVLAAGFGTTSWLWQQSDAALADVKRLADLELARELIARQATLWPALPAQRPAMLDWLAALRDLREREPLHRRVLGQLPPLGADRNADWQREQLESLFAELAHLGKFATDVERRIAIAASIVQRTVDDHAAKWDAVIERVGTSDRYGGLVLVPQVGLVPLGPDPGSGLEEFAHLVSGKLPSRDPTGQLRLDGESCLVLVLVPGGAAVLGAEATPPADGHAANVDATATAALGPCFTVALETFLLSKFEMTQEQWQRHTGKNPASYQIGNTLTPITAARQPVELVSWVECDRTLRELDLQLPSEAQWEWAYRAGTRTPYPYGADERSLAGHENLADSSARARAGHDRWHFLDWLDDGHLVHAPVGSFLGNGWGLFDMGGNVKEWCADTWEDYPDCAPRPGDGLRLGKLERFRIVRGGCFSSQVDEPRAASRGGSDKDTSGAEAGVRPARRLDR